MFKIKREDFLKFHNRRDDLITFLIRYKKGLEIRKRISSFVNYLITLFITIINISIIIILVFALLILIQNSNKNSDEIIQIYVIISLSITFTLSILILSFILVIYKIKNKRQYYKEVFQKINYLILNKNNENDRTIQKQLTKILEIKEEPKKQKFWVLVKSFLSEKRM
ncbi:MAG: hypothetical protein ACRCRZ_00185 [Metamycoplasmataceae bacterium]